MSERWPAILTPALLAEFLGCKGCDSTYQRRLKELRDSGLPEKDRGLGGWYRGLVETVLEKRCGLNNGAAANNGDDWLERIDG